jgi:2-aminoethylphosphonate transport system permease protein
MLVWSRGGRVAAWLTTLLVVGVLYLAPVAIILLASVAGQWNGVLPSQLTLNHFAQAAGPEAGSQIYASVVTAAVASLGALVAGTWAALSLRHMISRWKQVLDLLFFLPSAVPSVSVGLGLLVAFSRPPVLLNGTVWIVLIAHFVLISAFTFGAVSAGIARIPPDIEQAAESLGARPARRLWQVTLPLLAPHLISAFSLSLALSMGELGATAMIYPPGWVTMPVGIFALTDRGAVFEGAAQTVLLGGVTVLVLFVLGRIPTRSSVR